MRLLARAARRKYSLDEVDDASHAQLRRLAHAINAARDPSVGESERVHAGELGALLVLQDLLAAALAGEPTPAAAGREADEAPAPTPDDGGLDEALEGAETEALGTALAALEERLGGPAVDELLSTFLAEFEIFDEGLDPVTALTTPAGRRRTLAALVVLWQLNRNPAVGALRELFDDRALAPELYAPAMEILTAELRGRAGAEGGDREESLIERLEAPARRAPRSIAGQLEHFLERSPSGPVPRERVARALDALREERVRPPAGPGPIEVPRLDLPMPDVSAVDVSRGEVSTAPVPAAGGPAEPATGGDADVAPSAPRGEPDWMRRLVLGVKHTHVWLDQLSRAHGRPIARLDEVPTLELARLAELGISGLWLVGVWERSPASRAIKRRTGNEEAEASAYSIFDYRVAASLGGDEAIESLADRARGHGLRVGVDVVPNHFGIDSRWMREHPERFLAVDDCPFPNYTFEGPDLSSDPEIGLFLEDHYYDRSDAAVVFRHVDRRTGRERFVYHGNDGTSTPWNDTAQLDYSRPDVRRAMADLIFALAERFPILRFDAAMTLTRLHFQRLWFPAPGSGGAVPSRSEHGMSTERFAQVMPEEFWRDVVRRIDRDAPDTLLIAEAFWLMEPYFVRELGMHRVYNSAFMHLLRERQNDRLQRLLRDTMRLDPELLRRSVNFMSTPDEASAAEQFGTGDRSFGVCTLLATLPGLPLFGHGQVEGLAEKYGMEFRRARSEEGPNDELVARHRREILPLLADRAPFADLGGWRLLDFVGPGGEQVLDVYALCAGRGREARIVAFNNSDRDVEGRLRPGPPARGREEAGRESLAVLLGVAVSGEGASDAGGEFVLRDERTGVALQRSAEHLRDHGLELALGPWQALVLRRSG